MKFPSGLTALIIAGVCLSIALPIVAAISLARQQATERQQAYLLQLARDALHRSDQTGDQLTKAAGVVGALNRQSACSPAGLEVMRQLDLSSTMLQAVGYMDGNTMVCSSFGGNRPFELGPPDVRSTLGAYHRTNVHLPADPTVSYLAVQIGGFVGIVHKDLPLSFVDHVPELSLGIYSWSRHDVLLSRGMLRPGWLRSVASRGVFRDGNYMVAVVRSPDYDTAAVAALPLSQSAGFVREATIVLLPLGLLFGLLLSAVLIRVIHARASMPGLIRSALKGNKFFLLYQPVIDLATGRIVGAETLLRWRRSHGDPIPPDVFIPVAEQAGLMRLVTQRVLELLAADVGEVLRLAPDIHIGVNFSADDLHRPEIAEEVQAFAARTGMKPGNLIVEATERSFMNVELVRENLCRLQAAGIRIAIDDFGIGYSSLSYLAQLEIDYLKIDKLFVQSLGTDAATSHVAEHIIDMAKDLNLKIVAEGVETRHQERLLKRLKVDLAQGYVFAGPMSLEDLLQRLREQEFGGGRTPRLAAVGGKHARAA